MTWHRVINWTLALAVVVLYIAVEHIDGPPDWWQAQRDQAQALAAAAEAEEAEQRFVQAAQQLCGINAAWERIDATTVQCFTHKGRKTTKVTL